MAANAFLAQFGSTEREKFLFRFKMGNLFADDDFELCYDGVRFGEILSDLHHFSSDRDKWLVLEGHMLQLSTASSWCTIGLKHQKSEIYVLRKAAGGA